jgi:hypothetical protein
MADASCGRSFPCSTDVIMTMIGLSQRGQNEATCRSFSASLPLADNVYPAYPDQQDVILLNPI